MIQRIQTIYLFLAAACFGLFFILPFAKFTFMGADLAFDIHGLHVMHVESIPQLPIIPLPTENMSLMIVLASVIAAGCLLNIFLFKRRQLQIRIGYLLMFLCTIYIVMIFVYADQITAKTSLKPEYYIGMFVPVIQFILLFLANRSIRKDEQLVRSLDRLR